MNWRMYVAFLVWCFMNIFGGCFELAEKFRYELKKGAPDSIFAICGFLILSLITILVTILLSAWLIEDKATVGIIAASCFWFAVFTFVYNIIKAAFECFLVERQRVFDELKR
jgi:predicted membrane protein